MSKTSSPTDPGAGLLKPAGGVLDCSRALSQRHGRTALQQPSEAGAVVSREPVVARVRPIWRLVEAEQVRRRPAKCFGLLPPLGEEALAVLDALPPALDRNQFRRLGLEEGEPLAVARGRR